MDSSVTAVDIKVSQLPRMPFPYQDNTLIEKALNLDKRKLRRQKMSVPPPIVTKDLGKQERDKSEVATVTTRDRGQAQDYQTHSLLPPSHQPLSPSSLDSNIVEPRLLQSHDDYTPQEITNQQLSVVDLQPIQIRNEDAPDRLTET